MPLWVGPRVLEHIVDTVIYMEGSRQQPVRLVSSVALFGGATYVEGGQTGGQQAAAWELS